MGELRLCENCHADISAMHFNTRWCAVCRLARKKVQTGSHEERLTTKAILGRKRQRQRGTRRRLGLMGGRQNRDRRYKLARRARG